MCLDNNKNCNSIISKTNLILNIIIISEIFSWLGCITKNQLWNTMEESGWFISFIFFIKITQELYLINKNKNIKMQQYAYIIFILFLLFVDIPMYYNRSLKYKKKFKNIKDGILDIIFCKNISNSIKLWKNEIPWQTGYFIFASWFSIYMYKFYCKI